MSTRVLIGVLLLVLVAIGLVVCTILFERVLHQRRQANYDKLHRQMGLGPSGHDPVSKT